MQPQIKKNMNKKPKSAKNSKLPNDDSAGQQPFWPREGNREAGETDSKPGNLGITEKTMIPEVGQRIRRGKGTS
jgi:hypothetical protein